MIRKAKISKCGKYRYMLMREWDNTLPKVMFIMLNPSKADAEQDDPTIRRCISFAKDLGYGGFYVGNMFAYRATNPKTLKVKYNEYGLEYIVGPYNAKYLWLMIAQAEIIIEAWGNNVFNIFNKHEGYGFNFTKDGKNNYHLGLTNLGNPKHPLYILRGTKPIKYENPGS